MSAAKGFPAAVADLRHCGASGELRKAAAAPVRKSPRIPDRSVTPNPHDSHKRVSGIPGAVQSKELLDEAERLASEFPELAVAVAWSAVEYDLMSLSERTPKGDTMRKRLPSHLTSHLHKHGIIDASTVNVLKRMMNLRNMALHERWNVFGGISMDEANEHIALAKGPNEKRTALPNF